MLRGIALLLAILALTPVLAVQAEQPEPLVEYPNFPFQAGWTWVAGKLALGGPCDGKTFYVYSGEDISGELLGSDKAWTAYKPGWAGFTVYLSRPLREGEVITIYAECEEGKVVQDTFTVAPFEFWPKAIWFWYYPSIPRLELRAGARELHGQVWIPNEQCAAQGVVYVYSGGLEYPEPRELLGSGTVNLDGTFSVSLKCPPRQEELISVRFECVVNMPWGVAEEWYYLVPPPIVPEPATVLLVSGGLGMLALWAKNRRS